MIYNRVRDGRVYREYQEAMAVRDAARRLRELAGESRADVKTDEAKPLKLTVTDRRILAKPRYDRDDRAKLCHLYAPFEEAFLRYALSDSVAKYSHTAVNRPFRMCARIMLALDRTYWAFTWDELLAWREEHRRLQEGPHGLVTVVEHYLDRGTPRYSSWKCWRIARRRIAGTTWTSRASGSETETTRAIEDQFVATARAIGYRNDKQVRERGVRVLLGVLIASAPPTRRSISKADLEAWWAQTRRAPRVAIVGVTMAQKVLGAMGYLQGASPRPAGGGDSRSRATWGSTATGHHRHVRAVHGRPGHDATAGHDGHLRGGTSPLRRLAWARRSGGTVRRRCSAPPHRGLQAGGHRDEHRGLHQRRSAKSAGPETRSADRPTYPARCLSCVRALFETIDALEYPERPGRQLLIRGDVQVATTNCHASFPTRMAPLLDAAEALTPRRSPNTGRRRMSGLAPFSPCSWRAGCARASCAGQTPRLVAAEDEASGAVTTGSACRSANCATIG